MQNHGCSNSQISFNYSLWYDTATIAYAWSQKDHQTAQHRASTRIFLSKILVCCYIANSASAVSTRELRWKSNHWIRTLPRQCLLSSYELSPGRHESSANALRCNTSTPFPHYVKHMACLSFRQSIYTSMPQSPKIQSVHPISNSCISKCPWQSCTATHFCLQIRP